MLVRENFDRQSLFQENHTLGISNNGELTSFANSDNLDGNTHSHDITLFRYEKPIQNLHSYIGDDNSIFFRPPSDRMTQKVIFAFCEEDLNLVNTDEVMNLTFLDL